VSLDNYNKPVLFVCGRLRLYRLQKKFLQKICNKVKDGFVHILGEQLFTFHLFCRHSMDHSARILQLLATFLPVYGIVLTIVAALVLKNRWRIAAILLVPLITLLLCSHFGERIAYDGNLLYVVLATIYFAVVCIYYPVLLVIGSVWLLRRQNKAD
jgi:hypothetical protein